MNNNRYIATTQVKERSCAQEVCARKQVKSDSRVQALFNTPKTLTSTLVIYTFLNDMAWSPKCLSTEISSNKIQNNIECICRITSVNDVQNSKN